jgi:hypothetical protein
MPCGRGSSVENAHEAARRSLAEGSTPFSVSRIVVAAFRALPRFAAGQVTGRRRNPVISVG